jgi:hypothetical protein
MSGPVEAYYENFITKCEARIEATEAALYDAIRAMSAHGLYAAADRAKTVLEAGL